MLNLTESPIILIAESGETTTIPASGYVARVEKAREEVGYPTTSSALNSLVPIIEEAPTGIVIDCPDCKQPHRPYSLNAGIQRWCYQNQATEIPAILLVTREVAEAAATMKHPLWRRMVWAADEIRYKCDLPAAYEGAGFYHLYTCKNEHRESDDNGFILSCPQDASIICYRTLRRVPQGGAVDAS
jgi:hypothetical protein